MGLNLAFSWREGTEPDGEKQEMKKAKNLKVDKEKDSAYGSLYVVFN